MFAKPKFWDDKIGIYSVILYPFTLIILVFIFFKRKFSKKEMFDIPIICVGNIYIGGTGKTPTSILLAKELTRLKKNPVIVRKYYKSHKDEHDLLKSNFKNLILNKNRINGIKEAIKMNYDTIILDDGFQEYKIKNKLNIICFNKNQLIGNGLVLPSGPLRESLKSLNDADVILINGEEDRNFEKKILKINKSLKIFYSFYKPLNIDEFKNKNLTALASIGNPNNFFKLLEDHNLKIKKRLIYPDHYKFTEKQIKNIIFEAEENDHQIVMTEKDFSKFKHHKTNRLNYLRVSLELKKPENFLKEIKEVYA
tara:strand:+ start:360 stop:1289 length:930 start_codon:yes stop_codon:yes gene_type:complete